MVFYFRYVRERNLYESQLYTWRSKTHQQNNNGEREQQQLAEKEGEWAILQKAAIYFARRLK